MSGDYTRFTFAPRKRFSGVQMQQGRVMLDSDWNEEGELQRERTRLLGLDAGGRAWVAWRTTPDAFLIGVLPGPDLSLGLGRLYLEGRLAEVFDGEGVTYLHQPFLPEPDPWQPAIDTIVYLDMWEREVTWVEDTGLLDVALGGVDTTSRVQQVWQVKLHEQRGVAAQCGVDLDALFPQSGGRLTTSAIAPPAPDDPCILPPSAGYRGIENRLYRVEVQVGGPLGTARFKWSRDNGSVMTRVTGIAVAGGQTRLSVNRIGRDAVLRFSIGDWVTLTDDHRELHGEPGQMARIVDIDEAARAIVVDRAVPTSGRAFGATAAQIAERNTRLQRWDQKAPANALDADGLMTVQAGPVDLEDGVRADFSTVAGGQFKIGDYWVFAARTADASVEQLNQAPPRGIRHQYLQLAALPANAPPHDCRPAPPSEGCCTIVVKPGEDIQAAIDLLPVEGGCVCLKVGLHLIDRPLLLQADNVTIHGESLGAIVYNRRGTGLLGVAGGMHDRIHTIVFRQGEASSQPVIYLEGVEDFAIADCRIEMFERPGTIGLLAVKSHAVGIDGCRFAKPEIGISLQACHDVSVTGCSFVMAEPRSNGSPGAAVIARRMDGAVLVEDCNVAGAVNGIVIDDDPAGQPASRARFSRVTGNRIEMAANPRGNSRTFGIDLAAPETMADHNLVQHSGGEVTAIRLCGSRASASDNSIICRREEITTAVAIAIGHEGPNGKVPVSQVTVTGNVIDGTQSGVVATGTTQAEIVQNIMGRKGLRLALTGVLLDECTDCTVADNTIVGAVLIGLFAHHGARNRYSGNRIDGAAFGIAVGMEAAPAIAGNRVTGSGMGGIVGLVVSERCEMIENRVTHCGWNARTGTGMGAYLVMGEWHVEANEVMDTGLPPEAGGPRSALAYGISGDLILEARIESNLVTYSAPNLRPLTAEDRALRLRGLVESGLSFGGGTVHIGFAAQIADNKFVGPGQSALVELREQQLTPTTFIRFERVMLTGNYCNHFTTGQNAAGRASAQLVGRVLNVANNQIKATTPGYASFHMHGRPGPMIGNVIHAPTLGRNVGQQFPTPESAFNIIA